MDLKEILIRRAQEIELSRSGQEVEWSYCQNGMIAAIIEYLEKHEQRTKNLLQGDQKP